MNRPKLEDYKVFNKEGLITPRLVKYTTDLEKYCDQIEKVIDKFVKHNAEGWCCKDPFDCTNTQADCEKCWRRWAMKDE